MLVLGAELSTAFREMYPITFDRILRLTPSETKSGVLFVRREGVEYQPLLLWKAQSADMGPLIPYSARLHPSDKTMQQGSAQNDSVISIDYCLNTVTAARS